MMLEIIMPIGVIGNIKDSFIKRKLLLDNIDISKATLERILKQTLIRAFRFGRISRIVKDRHDRER